MGTIQAADRLVGDELEDARRVAEWAILTLADRLDGVITVEDLSDLLRAVMLRGKLQEPGWPGPACMTLTPADLSALRSAAVEITKLWSDELAEPPVRRFYQRTDTCRRFIARLDG